MHFSFADFYGPELCQTHADIISEEEKKPSLILANALPNIESVGFLRKDAQLGAKENAE
jgi:hypothetical protein